MYHPHVFWLCYAAIFFKLSVLKDKVSTISGTQNQLKDRVTFLEDQLKDLRAFETKLNDIERQQQELAKQQEACQRTVETHDKALEELKSKKSETGQELLDLRTELDTSRTQTKQDIEQVKAMQEDYQQQTNQRFDDLTTTSDPIPTDEGKQN